MSRRFWILAATCAALSIGTFTPEQAQAGWRRRCGGRVHGCRYRGGYAWRGGWGGAYGGYGGYGGYGYGGYGICSTGFGFGGNYMTGTGVPYGIPYRSAYSMPYYASTFNVSPYFGGAYNAMGVTNAPRFYTASLSAGQQVPAPAYPGDPVAISSPSISFLARYTAVVRNSSSDRSEAGTSFLARYSSFGGNAVQPIEAPKSEVKPGYGYGYGLAAGSGYNYKSRVVNATKDLTNFGFISVAMNP